MHFDRFRYGRFDDGRVARRRVGSADPLGTPFRTQSLGGFFRPAQNDAAISAGQPNGTFTLSEVRLLVGPPLSPATHQFVQKGSIV